MSRKLLACLALLSLAVLPGCVAPYYGPAYYGGPGYYGAPRYAYRPHYHPGWGYRRW